MRDASIACQEPVDRHYCGRASASWHPESFRHVGAHRDRDRALVAVGDPLEPRTHDRGREDLLARDGLLGPQFEHREAVDVVDVRFPRAGCSGANEVDRGLLPDREKLSLGPVAQGLSLISIAAGQSARTLYLYGIPLDRAPIGSSRSATVLQALEKVRDGMKCVSPSPRDARYPPFACITQAHEGRFGRHPSQD